MGQFDVHRNPAVVTADDFPYLLDIQSDILELLDTRVVVPLMPATRYGKPIDRLNPVFDIEGQAYVGVFTEMAGIPRFALGEVVCSQSDRRDDIIGAVDFILQGF
ncbi:MAG: CcdB family protein [Kiloniellaceae bacterium]